MQQRVCGELLIFDTNQQFATHRSIASLGARWNTRIIMFPEAAPVSRGPYRFMRHPNYLPVIVEMACVLLIHGCWLTAIVFSIGNASLLCVRIRAEETAMVSILPG
jgi:methyltransferase